MKANIGPDWVIMRMWLLIRMHVEQADNSVHLKASFLAKNKQGTRSTDLQVMRQQEGDCFADQ